MLFAIFYIITDLRKIHIITFTVCQSGTPSFKNMRGYYLILCDALFIPFKTIKIYLMKTIIRSALKHFIICADGKTLYSKIQCRRN